MRWRSYRDGEDELRCARACAALGDRRKRTEEEDGGVAGRATGILGRAESLFHVFFFFFFRGNKCSN